MAVPTPFDLLAPVLGGLFPLVLVAAVLLAGTFVAPRAVGPLRQAAYDRATQRERVRLELLVPAGYDPDPAVGVELLRALHTRHRRGVDPFRVGWPRLELRLLWRDTAARWQIDCPAQLEAAVRVALRSACPGIGIEAVPIDDRPAVAAATARLTASDRWPLHAAQLADGRALVRLAHALAAERAAEVLLRVKLRPCSPERWRPLVDPDEGTTSIASLVGTAIVDALLFRETASAEPVQRQLSTSEREAAKRKRVGIVGFEAAALLEVAGVDADAAHALLWHLTSWTDVLGDARQALDWRIGRGRGSLRPVMRLADWEVAELWELPSVAFDRTGAARPRALAGAAPAPDPGGPGLVIGEARGRPVTLPTEVLGRHLAVFGATGSGKSTLLLTLATQLLQSDIGGTIIDPHGDLAEDILARVPLASAGRVHVLRLADRDHPRGFNFLERRSPDEAQLVTSEFVDMLEDLWPRFCGPKMQDYLRHGLLTLLSSPEPQTILELIRLLTDDAFRETYTKALADPLLAHFWRTQWPGPRERERDASIKAVLNKLGAFVAYDSIRQVVGQGVSTIRPRTLMDRGDVLVVDLSRVGGDNASLFGAMLISRYLIDAVGRQGTPRASRRPHLLVVDEAQGFDTRALGRISVEGRKFGLALGLASQSLAGLGERLQSTILTNAASLVLLSPGANDVRTVGRLFAPLAPERLTDLRRFEFVLRTPGPDGSPAVYGGRVIEPAAADPGVAERVTAASDRRDARPTAEVRAEVHRRAGGNAAPPAPDRAAAASDER